MRLEFHVGGPGTKTHVVIEADVPPAHSVSKYRAAKLTMTPVLYGTGEALEARTYDLPGVDALDLARVLREGERR